MINVLLVAAGRRVTFGTQLQKHNCKVFGYDLAKEVPLSDIATIIIGKKWDDLDLVDHLNETIDSYNIDLVIPLDCKGVESISKISDQLNTNIVCTNPKSALFCLDKLKLQSFMTKNFPDWYPSPVLDKPCIIKPRFGYGSEGIQSNPMYSKNLSKSEEVVVQYKLVGQEYSVDAYFNKQGRMVGASPRTRLWVSGGEVLESETVQNKELIAMTKAIGEKLKMNGPTCFQYIKDEADNPKLTEINARAGGGSTISIEAGLDFIELIIKEYIYNMKLEEDSAEAEHGVYCSRSFKDHYFRI